MTFVTVFPWQFQNWWVVHSTESKAHLLKSSNTTVQHSQLYHLTLWGEAIEYQRAWLPIIAKMLGKSLPGINWKTLQTQQPIISNFRIIPAPARPPKKNTSKPLNQSRDTPNLFHQYSSVHSTTHWRLAGGKSGNLDLTCLNSRLSWWGKKFSLGILRSHN